VKRCGDWSKVRIQIEKIRLVVTPKKK
jgi:hypothetical protein